MTSREKTEAFLRQVAAEARPENPIAAAAPAMLPMVLGTLPDDPAVLDQVLVEWAGIMLALRSDGAAALHVAEGEPDEAPA